MSEEQRSPAMDYAAPGSRHRPQRFATTAVVIGILSLIVPLLGIVAIMLGLKARDGAQRQGFVAARRTRVAILLGLIGLGLHLALGGVWWRHQVLESRRDRCGMNMRSLAQAMLLYGNENRSAFPPSVATLLVTQAQDLVPNMCICPVRTRDIPNTAFTDDWTARREGRLDYVLVREPQSLDPNPHRFNRGTLVGPFVAEPLRNHVDRGAHMIDANGQPVFLNRAQAFKLYGELRANFQITDEEYQFLIAE